MIYIFNIYYQEVTKNIIWENSIPKSIEEDELDKELAEELEQIQLPDDMETSSNKRALEEVEEMLVGTFATSAYRLSSKKSYNREKMDTSDEESTQELQSSLVPE